VTGRRVPMRRPANIPLGAQMTVRQRIDDQLYELYGGSRLGSPEYGTFSGATVLAPGTRVRATWRQESQLWEIDGPARQNEQGGPVGFFAMGGDSVTEGVLFTLKTVDAQGVVAVGENDPATPPSPVERLRFSPNGEFVAVTYSTTLAVYAYTNGDIGALIDTIALPAGAATGSRHGLAWHPDSDFIAVGFADTTGDSLGVYSWDGTTLTNVDLVPDVSSSGGATACAWNKDGVHLAVGYFGGKVHLFTWDGSTLTDVDTGPFSVTSTIQSLTWSPSGVYLLVAINNSGFLTVVELIGSTLGSRINPAVAPNSSGSGEADWYPQEDRIVFTSSSNNVYGYPWTGSAFGTRVVDSGGTRNRRSLRVDPTGTYFVVALDGIGAGGLYGEVFTFDGTTITNIAPDFGSGVTDTYTTEDVDFPPQGPVLPAQQVDASDVTYTPADATDWSVIPSRVDGALDELAARIPLTRSSGLALGGFSIITGTPVLSTGAQWAFDATTDEAIIGYFVIPQLYGADGLFRFHYLMASATSGTVEWEATVLATIEGEDTSAAGASTSVADTVQGTAVNMGTVDVTPVHTYAAGDVVRIKLARLGTSDSAAGDALLLAVEFVYTLVSG